MDPLVIPAADTPGLDHGNHGYIVIITAVVCLSLATVAVAMRLYTRRIVLNQVWIDDYLAVISWIFLTLLCVFGCIQTRFGVGAHIWDVGLAGLENFNKFTWIGLLIYNFSLLPMRATFFFQYFRIVRTIPRQRIIYAVVGVLVSIWGLANLFLMVFTCVPIQANWDTSVVGKCNPLGAYDQGVMTSSLNILSDVVVLLLPIPVVLKLQMSKAQKYVLVGLFSLGFFTCAISSFRLIFLRKPADMTWDSVGIICWSMTEVSAGTLCASIPTLRPLFIRYFPNVGSTNRSRTGYEMYDAGSLSKRKSTGKVIREDVESVE
ncbi:hypothetical protein BX600DRAFT_514469 [Xylariales sp. PMI_506]|nr:hypothetical protein BX600DRAFT_514469 [Xylariales sp. PMI_506]